MRAEQHFIFCSRLQIIIRKPGNSQVVIFFGRIHMPGRTVLINKQGHVSRHISIGPEAADNLKGPVTLSLTATPARAALVSFALQLQMQPHHVFARFCIVNYFRPFHNTTGFNVVTGMGTVR